MELRRGAAAALAALGTAEGLALALRAPSPLDAAGTWVIDRGPVPVVEQTVVILGTADKPVIRAAAAGTILAGGAALGAVVSRGRRAGAVAGVAMLGALLSARRRATAAAPADHLRTRAAVPAAAGAAVALVALAAPVGVAGPVAAAGGVAVAGALAERARRRNRHDRSAFAVSLPLPARPLPDARDGAEAWQGVSPLHTPVEDFYVTDVNMRPPLVDPLSWRLAVEGAVERPLILSLEEIAAMGTEEFDAVLVCIHHRLDWGRLGNQRWLGVPLARVLEMAGADPDAQFVVTGSVDGFEQSLPLTLPAPYTGYVVLGMGGRPLTASHGAPARVLVPGLYGQYTGAKWLTTLRVQTEPNQDYWLPRGWPRGPAFVRPLSRIDVPAPRERRRAGPLTVAGVAWAPPHGVLAVQVAVDGEWQQAELARELAPTSWRRWRLTVDLPPGRHELRARCTSRTGKVQSALPAAPYPSGVSGHHSITITAS